MGVTTVPQFLHLSQMMEQAGGTAGFFFWNWKANQGLLSCISSKSVSAEKLVSHILISLKIIKVYVQVDGCVLGTHSSLSLAGKGV